MCRENSVAPHFTPESAVGLKGPSSVRIPTVRCPHSEAPGRQTDSRSDEGRLLSAVLRAHHYVESLKAEILVLEIYVPAIPPMEAWCIPIVVVSLMPQHQPSHDYLPPPDGSIRIKTVGQFLQRQRVLGIYRNMLRAIRKVPDQADRKYLSDWARDEFKRNKNATDQDAIRMMITQASNHLEELHKSLALAGRPQHAQLVLQVADPLGESGSVGLRPLLRLPARLLHLPLEGSLGFSPNTSRVRAPVAPSVATVAPVAPLAPLDLVLPRECFFWSFPLSRPRSLSPVLLLQRRSVAGDRLLPPLAPYSTMSPSCRSCRSCFFLWESAQSTGRSLGRTTGTDDSGLLWLAEPPSAALGCSRPEGRRTGLVWSSGHWELEDSTVTPAPSRPSATDEQRCSLVLPGSSFRPRSISDLKTVTLCAVLAYGCYLVFVLMVQLPHLAVHQVLDRVDFSLHLLLGGLQLVLQFTDQRFTAAAVQRSLQHTANIYVEGWMLLAVCISSRCVWTLCGAGGRTETAETSTSLQGLTFSFCFLFRPILALTGDTLACLQPARSLLWVSSAAEALSCRGQDRNAITIETTL
ncbi:hypothetical protein FQN60_015809 [Etheostoma spectabile]|uniref:LYR motif-containing protein 2 n=1 Tax=Etheostoma spectabile TaxID=54343 RepID=A0A5J5CR24_9PERO|nr:hypothetical protein FQN60_015809 [Etheostoma spectabile]